MLCRISLCQQHHVIGIDDTINTIFNSTVTFIFLDFIYAIQSEVADIAPEIQVSICIITGTIQQDE